MANRYFTILIIPEKTSRVRRILIPTWILKGAFLGAFSLLVLAFIMTLDYWYVMSRITENKDLKAENRRLRQEVQIFKNKVAAVESTLDRIQTFATRLRVITNIEETQIQSLNQKLPDAATNIGTRATVPNVQDLLVTPMAHADERDPEAARLRKEQEELEERFSLISKDSLNVEQNLQDLYELLVDQKAFLSALPTRKPTIGYFTSGFGVRRSPYGGSEKMHEGLDVANHPGTPIWATANAVVSYAGRKPGYGRTVILDHGYGMETWYGHTTSILVKLGQRVLRGQKIALMGSTGRSTGPHVHYEVRVHGIPVDPLSYILED